MNAEHHAEAKRRSEQIGNMIKDFIEWSLKLAGHQNKAAEPVCGPLFSIGPLEVGPYLLDRHITPEDVREQILTNVVAGVNAFNDRAVRYLEDGSDGGPLSVQAYSNGHVAIMLAGSNTVWDSSDADHWDERDKHGLNPIGSVEHVVERLSEIVRGMGHAILLAVDGHRKADTPDREGLSDYLACHLHEHRLQQQSLNVDPQHVIIDREVYDVLKNYVAQIGKARRVDLDGAQ
jgi:hypothetical protein